MGELLCPAINVNDCVTYFKFDVRGWLREALPCRRQLELQYDHVSSWLLGYIIPEITGMLPGFVSLCTDPPFHAMEYGKIYCIYFCSFRV